MCHLFVLLVVRGIKFLGLLYKSFTKLPQYYNTTILPAAILPFHQSLSVHSLVDIHCIYANTYSGYI